MSESQCKHADQSVTANEAQAPLAGGKPSSVEIFARQLTFNIHPGQTKQITLTGSIYDHHFSGTVKVDANGPVSSACPIFASIGNSAQHVSLPMGANQAIITVTFTCPPNTPTGSYNCALKYKATQDNGLSVGKGNEVGIGYNVRPK